jgi:hypothetical protein
MAQEYMEKVFLVQRERGCAFKVYSKFSPKKIQIANINDPKKSSSNDEFK